MRKVIIPVAEQEVIDVCFCPRKGRFYGVETEEGKFSIKESRESKRRLFYPISLEDLLSPEPMVNIFARAKDPQMLDYHAAKGNLFEFDYFWDLLEWLQN